MVVEVDKVVKLYKSLSEIPALLRAYYFKNGLMISSEWSQQNLDTGKRNTFQINHFLTEKVKSFGQTIAVDVSYELISRFSPSENYRAVIRDIEGKESKKQLLEIWSNQNLAHAIDVSALDIHGDIYVDSEFGGIQWSQDESKLVYIAEKKNPKAEPFYKRKPKKDDNNENTTPVKKGEEYLFRQDWGEQLVGKKESVVVVFHLRDEEFQILEGIPETLFPGQVTFTPDGNAVVGVVYETEPRKLGLIFCSNRASYIFQLDFNKNFLKISEEGRSVKSPKFTLDGETLIWFQSYVGGPHKTAVQLVKKKFPFDVSETPKVVVDIVNTEIKITNNDTFYGLYTWNFARRCWASERRLLLSTNQRNTVKSYVVDIDSNEITELSYKDGNLVVLDVYEDVILFNYQNFLTSDKLLSAQLPSKTNEKNIVFHDISKPMYLPFYENMKFSYLNLEQEGSSKFKSFSAIYLGPKNGDEKSVPLIVYPHGGPHSAFSNSLSMETSMYLALGYAILLVNYRGSIGNGKDCVDSLLGNIGTNDVSDCILATKIALNTFNWLNPDKLALIGGSHGGFLVLHLSGQYPDMFKVVAARNPVVDILFFGSDIPDWAYVQAGFDYKKRDLLSSDQILTMRKKSPIIHAHKVRAPTLLQIGSKDLRVPHLQSMEYYYSLKEHGKKVCLNLYDDNHSLSQVPHFIDNLINTVIWIDKHI